jgi:DNA-binding GntR family transcriptional regulator
MLREQSLFIFRWIFSKKMPDKIEGIFVNGHQAIWESLSQGDSEGASRKMIEHLYAGEKETLERVSDMCFEPAGKNA